MISRYSSKSSCCPLNLLGNNNLNMSLPTNSSINDPGIDLFCEMLRLADLTLVINFSAFDIKIYFRSAYINILAGNRCANLCLTHTDKQLEVLSFRQMAYPQFVGLLEGFR